MMRAKKMLNRKQLRSHVKNELIRDSEKIRGKHLSISEVVDGAPKIYSIKSIFSLKKKMKNFFLFLIKNNSKKSKIRYFLAISLASQSSDLLVSLAESFKKKNNDLKLIQYSIFPRNYRINLILLKEINSVKDYQNSVVLLKSIRIKFRKKMNIIKDLIENE